MWLARIHEPATTGASAFEGVLDPLAGLLEVALGLVGLAFGLQVAITAGIADGFLGFAGQFFGLVFDLVVGTHVVLLLGSKGHDRLVRVDGADAPRYRSTLLRATDDGWPA